MDLAEHENMLLPEELDTVDESPYLRRQKAVAVRRSQVPGRLRWVLFGIGVLLPVGFVGYFLATWALTSPCFVLNSADDVVVVGNRFASREEILNALGVPFAGKAGGGISLFRISLEAKRKQVESVPWIRSAAVTRMFPHRLLVHVVERVPVAHVNMAGRVSLVDGDGVLLEKPESASFDFPVINGLDTAGSPDERRARLTLYQEFMRDLGEEIPRSGWLVSEVDLADPEDLRALLVQGRETLRVHFGHREFLARFRSFLMLLPEMRQSNTKLDSVDLRYRNQIVVNPRPSASPEGRGTSAASTPGTE